MRIYDFMLMACRLSLVTCHLSMLSSIALSVQDITTTQRYSHTNRFIRYTTVICLTLWIRLEDFKYSQFKQARRGATFTLIFSIPRL